MNQYDNTLHAKQNDEWWLDLQKCLVICDVKWLCNPSNVTLLVWSDPPQHSALTKTHGKCSHHYNNNSTSKAWQNAVFRSHIKNCLIMISCNRVYFHKHQCLYCYCHGLSLISRMAYQHCYQLAGKHSTKDIHISTKQLSSRITGLNHCIDLQQFLASECFLNKKTLSEGHCVTQVTQISKAD